MAAGQSKVVGLCDVDPTPWNRRREVKDQTGDEPSKYKDFRELLDKEKPEIVIIATPDHWHALTCHCGRSRPGATSSSRSRPGTRSRKAGPC